MSNTPCDNTYLSRKLDLRRDGLSHVTGKVNVLDLFGGTNQI